MWRTAQVLIALIGALAFGRFVHGAHLEAMLQPLTVALSIFTAAVLVRLARGMPTLDWKSVPIESRKRLTQQLVDVAVEYAGLLGWMCVLLAVVIAIVGFKTAPLEVMVLYDFEIRSVVVGFFLAFVAVRLGYVIWRDLDITRLQKAVIDKMAETEAKDASATEADKRLAAMQATMMRGSMTIPKEEWRAKA